MDLLSISLALFFLVVTFILFERYIQGDNFERIDAPPASGGPDGAVAEQNGMSTTPSVNGMVSGNPKGDDTIVKEVVYTQDYYPWWTGYGRSWNYDGWLYQKPYYNYWRRPYYYNYYMSGRPLIVDGNRYHHKNPQ